MSKYEEMVIDRREKYFEDSARFRNDANDFSARFKRGEAIQLDMRARLVAGTDWQKIEQTEKARRRNVTYRNFGRRA